MTRDAIADRLIVLSARIVGGREYYRRLSHVWNLGLAEREELADPKPVGEPVGINPRWKRP